MYHRCGSGGFVVTSGLAQIGGENVKGRTSEYEGSEVDCITVNSLSVRLSMALCGAKKVEKSTGSIRSGGILRVFESR